jgi:hypothetical protein
MNGVRMGPSAAPIIYNAIIESLLSPALSSTGGEGDSLSPRSRERASERIPRKDFRALNP